MEKDYALIMVMNQKMVLFENEGKKNILFNEDISSIENYFAGKIMINYANESRFIGNIKRLGSCGEKIIDIYFLKANFYEANKSKIILRPMDEIFWHKDYGLNSYSCLIKFFNYLDSQNKNISGMESILEK